MYRRHRIVYAILRPLVAIFLWFRFGYTFKSARRLPDNYIVLSNHLTDYDPLLVGVSFKQMYFVASEHIARWKHAFKFIKFGFDPILRYKGALASSMVVEMLRHVRKGRNVCMFAEGVRSWDGTPSPIAYATAKLIRTAGCGLVTYKITGGYFVSPMWATTLRRGPLHGEPVNVYTKEQLEAMSVDEIYEAICNDLSDDAYDRQLAAPKKYRGKALAKGLESLLFICPHCGAHDTLTTLDDAVHCKQCGHAFTYDAYGMLHGTVGDTVKALSLRQKAQIADDVANGAAYRAVSATLATVNKHEETPLTEGPVTMSPAGFACGDVCIPLEDIAELAMHGRYAIVFSAKKTYYELIVQDSNALKFFLYYNAWKQAQDET